MSKIMKIERKNYSSEELPAFLITVDTGMASDSNISDIMDAIVSDPSFAYCPQGISTYEAIKAANTFHSKEDVAKKSTWDRVDLGEGVCQAGEFLFNYSGSHFIVAGVEDLFISSMGTWLVSYWGVNLARAAQWRFD